MIQELLLPGGGTQKCKLAMDGMGQLQLFVATDNATTRFEYFGNSGLLTSKSTSQGHTFLYKYDANGRLSSVIQSTGERRDIDTEGEGNVLYII